MATVQFRKMHRKTYLCRFYKAVGLAETLVQHVQRVHSQLNMASLQLVRGGTRRKEDPLVQELILHFALLRNFMLQNQDVKLACHHCGLSGLLHGLWAYALVDPSLLSATLNLILTFIAHCPQAAASLAYTTSSAAHNSTVDGKQCLSSSSLVHCLLKVAASTSDRDVTRVVFSILATLTLSPQCCSIMWKGNFFSEFSKLTPGRPAKSARHLQWLELITNLSFSTEGHQIILNISGCMGLLLEYLKLDSARCRECSLLILRNLCCHASNKQKLLSNDDVLPALLQCLTGPGIKLQAMAASALWALIFNNQKAKVIMKNACILGTLQESHQRLTSSTPWSDLQTQCAEDLKSVIELVGEAAN